MKKVQPVNFSALAKEVKKLLDNKLIEQSDKYQWVTSVMLEKKGNNSWQAINFTDLNEACSEDYFMMPHMTTWLIAR